MAETPSASGETESDMDFEPSSTSETDADDLDNVEFLEQLIERGENEYHVPGQYVDDEDDDENDDEDEEGATEDGTTHYFEVEIEEEPAQVETETEDERSARHRRQVMRLLANSELGRLFFAAAHQGELEDDDDANFHPRWYRRRNRPPPEPDRFPKVPSEAGIELMNSGSFGLGDAQTIEEDLRTKIGKKKKLAMRILQRELAQENYSKQKLNQKMMAQSMIPSSNPDMIIHYNQPVYSGQFSDDGNFFFSVNKDYKVRMYDTSNPYKWRHYKTVEYPFGQWTLTDASLSPDNKYLAYTSIKSTVSLAPTDPNDQGDPYSLDLSSTGQGHLYSRRNRGSFGIWSIRFSGDGRKLVAGATGGLIVVYDIESRRTLHQIEGHDDDVNAVCFADSSSPHILYSGSDDTTLKVWDTRSMGDSRAAGAFIGHIEGLTYIDSKMDGRYILSNGKDQSMKLWDLRMVMSTHKLNTLPPSRRTNEPRFDYRMGAYDEDNWYVDENDNSLVTFRGHKVLRTLIRCHFSPPGSTNSRYVYSGSEDGKVYIWNMDATLAGTVNVYNATKNSRPPGNDFVMGWDDDERWRTCIRDASWHPSAPMIVASAWSGYGMGTGTCTVHSWNDGAEEDEAEPRMGLRVNQKLEYDPAYYAAAPRTNNTRRRFGLRSLLNDDNE